LSPKQRLIANRSEEDTEHECPFTKLRLPKTRYNSLAKIKSSGDRSECPTTIPQATQNPTSRPLRAPRVTTPMCTTEE